MDSAFTIAGTTAAYWAGSAVIIGTIRLWHTQRRDPNAVFALGRRSTVLRLLFPVWALGMLGVVLTVWSLRLGHLAEVMQGPAGWVGKGVLATVLLCEAAITLYWLQYVRFCALEARATPLPVDTSGQTPRVLVLIPARDESIETLERSIPTARAIQWPRLRVVVVDNSLTAAGQARTRGACSTHSVECLHVPNRGGKAAALNDASRILADDAPILAVFDADQSIVPHVLQTLVPRLMADGGLAFVQSAQSYQNTDTSWVARAAAQQEMLLYDAIAGGRGAAGRAPCCGTNFAMRTQALSQVGGWDEHTVSEDQVTAFHMHRIGWRSAYHRELLATGLGPVDLPSYWKQQYRWAHGATRMGLLALRHRSGLGARIDTLWSASFYALTLIFAAMGTLPMLLNLTQLSTEPSPSLWALSVYPLYLLAMLFPYLHMWLRGYALRDLLLVQGLLAVSVPIYARAVAAALLGRPATFTPTPRAPSTGTSQWWRQPPVLSLAILLVLGPILLHRALVALPAPMPWAPVAWVALATVSVGHFFLFSSPSMSRPSPAPRHTHLKNTSTD